LPKTFSIDIPETLLDEIEKCKNDTQVKEIGIQWAIQQSKELIKFGAPCMHYYTMGSAELTRQIAAAIF